MIEFIQNLLSFVLALGILVAVHEWGHFWVARRCQVKVLTFSIGFGKALWSRVDKHGTEFVIAAIPLGGYVKMLDERVGQVATEDLPYAFTQKTPLQRMAIVSAGPIVNFIFAFVALYAVLLIGQDARKPIIGDVSHSSIASEAGLQNGDLIAAIDGRDISDWQGVSYQIMRNIGDQHMQVVVDRTGVRRELNFDLTQWQFNPETQSPFTTLGFEQYRPEITKQIAFVSESSPAEAAGIQVNDIILAFDGTPVENWEQIVEQIEQRPQQDVIISLLRDNAEIQLTALIGVNHENDGKGLLGVIPFAEPYPETHIFYKQYGVFEGIGQGITDTWGLITLSVDMLGKLFTGDISINNLSGPISIAQGAGTSASYGLVTFLGFLALISVNLGIINLLPLPVLDGGHLMYYTLEWVTGKPVPEAIQEIGFKIGAFVLLLLMSVAFYNDIARL